MLKDLSIRYAQNHPSLQALSKVDMALWAAAHLSTDVQCSSLAKEMNSDEFFQEVRLKNLARGFGSHWTRTDAQRLILSRVLLEHDFILAALIATRAFESIVFEIVARAAIQLDDFGESPDHLEYLIRKIKEKRLALFKLDVRGDELDKWRKCRNHTVHPKSLNNPMTLERARDFVRGVQKLHDNLSKL